MLVSKRGCNKAELGLERSDQSQLSQLMASPSSSRSIDVLLWRRPHLKLSIPFLLPRFRLGLLPTMLRTQLVRSAVRAGKHARPAVSRTFASSAQRNAEVELTVGMSLRSTQLGKANVCRWKEGLDRRSVGDLGLINGRS